ncbi:hypothetical protein Snoj_56450 [Streptomyces nojiriensis]|uniref:Uncharacterized protein n=1 Tax=Streptomyces nojiriensis TaxID=66374 RepID=A0ABQ3SU98_9ACTN|nr:hypothetical protein GCM10010205_23980 [Streptomyces nojiriensis]GHI71727.1 hypothetical protein Snoj_56450 [Streptomyces nojiriensis]
MVVGGLCPAQDGRRTLRDEERVAIWRAPPTRLPVWIEPVSWLSLTLDRHGHMRRPVLILERPARSFGGFPAVFVPPGRDGRSRVERSDIAKRRDEGAPLRDRPDPETIGLTGNPMRVCDSGRVAPAH